MFVVGVCVCVCGDGVALACFIDCNLYWRDASLNVLDCIEGMHLTIR